MWIRINLIVIARQNTQINCNNHHQMHCQCTREHIPFALNATKPQYNRVQDLYLIIMWPVAINHGRRINRIIEYHHHKQCNLIGCVRSIGPDNGRAPKRVITTQLPVHTENRYKQYISAYGNGDEQFGITARNAPQHRNTFGSIAF